MPLRNDPAPDDWCAARERELLAAALPHVERCGWTDRLVRAAAHTLGMTAAEAELVLPQGPRDLAALLARRHDEAMLAALEGVDPAPLKVRERIGRAVKARLEAAMRDEAAVRRCTGFLALPANASLAAGLLWRTADAVWRWAGDTATDENHYSKRVILSGVLASALLVRLGRGRAEAEAFVDRRIEDVMRFERWKATRPRTDPLAAVAGVLGRLRYRA